MEKTVRRIEQSPIYQGEDEEIYYTVDTSTWGGSPSSVSVVVKQNGDDVSETLLTGSASVNGDVITLPKIADLVDGTHYRLEVKFTSSGNIIEAWAELIGQE